ncbi:DUF1731 domain-containing protein [Microbacterium dauci]|uniref:DUF1731 domain-containing protein n=1 Tax=Microbacterium dauci TaxID=3048008 RepID=A0ABT6ZBX5_9MICO|nr:DUF1731 domain-containing protein [Microbacterium sp. LX3-4]MDJ1113662.1 DUF1731 domain-containing protein [Microbacterium sp. LX3-4]
MPPSTTWGRSSSSRAPSTPRRSLLRTEPELVLKSRWVLPERLTGAGYRFQRTDLEAALRDVAATTRVRRRRERQTRSTRS